MVRPVVSALLLVASLSGCGDATTAEGAPEPSGVACGPVETQPDQGHQHLVGDAEPPVDYLTSPPTSGWHIREPERIQAAIGVHEEPLTELQQVSVQSVGLAVIAHHDLSADERRALEELAASEYPGRVAVTPYDRLETGEVALAAWRTLQRCEGVDEDAIAAFVEEFAAAEPDYSMGGEDDDH